MIPAIVIGRGQSKGFPGKNTEMVDGHPMMAYPIMAAEESKRVDEAYFSTEDAIIRYWAFRYRAEIIYRPDFLATDEALGEDVFVHAYNAIKAYADDHIEYVVLMFANAPCVTGQMIDEMVSILDDKNHFDFDSIATISKYNMYHPMRMRKYKKNHIAGGAMQVTPWMNEAELVRFNCDRDSGGDVWIYDCSCAVVRPDCLEKIQEGTPPQRWLGKYVLGYPQVIPALDVDYAYQVGQVEYWLKNKGGRN